MARPEVAGLEKLGVNDLKTKITNTWGKYKRAAQRTMGPLLYHLRKKLKAQGKSSAGFGAWVEDNVDISRRTADRCDLTGKICTRWNERESTWRKSGTCRSRGTSQSKS
jgi:hypothetical protein